MKNKSEEQHIPRTATRMVGHPFLYIFFAYFASLPQFTCNKILFNNIALPGNDKRFEIFVFVKYLVKYFLNVLNLLEVGQ